MSALHTLRLTRHYDEGKQEGDDGLLVHIRFLFLVSLLPDSLTFHFV